MDIISWCIWLMRLVPLLLVYVPVCAFTGYIIDPDERNSGKWYSDALSTIGIFVGIFVAFALAA